MGNLLVPANVTGILDMGKSDILQAAVDAGLATDASELTFSGEKLTNVTTGKSFFAKSGSNVAQIRGEAEGLRHIAAASPGLVPTVHVAKEAQGGQRMIFISDYLDLKPSTSRSLDNLARKMALELHNPDKHTGVRQFGFPIPTHCGVTEQDNTWTQDWMEFFRDRRIGNLLGQIEKKRGATGNRLFQLGTQLQERVIPKLLSDFQPPPRPVLLHGDAWSGNIASSSDGMPVMYDCSAYYGHNEAEFGISRMFGPFNAAFYDSYHSILERSQPHYEERQQLYELYHLINHYLMFGGSYSSGAERIMKDLLGWAERQ